MCPDVFEQNTGQKANIVECYQLGSAADGEIGEPLQKCAQEAADSCPVNVIDTGD
jgi:ferredoxin